MENIDFNNYFSYDPNTGLLSWKIKRKGVTPGPILTTCKQGYVVVSVNRKRRYVHRIICSMLYGISSNTFVDHINGCKNDNRLCNLRLTNKSGNELNKKKTTRNKTGYKNISYYNSDKSYVAEIRINGKKIKKYMKSDKGDLKVLTELNNWISNVREDLCNGFHNHGEYNHI